ncbi:MAG: cytochrome c biogenesis protein [Pseudanabaena sp. ELA607]
MEIPPQDPQSPPSNLPETSSPASNPVIQLVKLPLQLQRQLQLFWPKLWRRFWQKQILAVLANLQFAIGLLLAIAAASILGTVIEQGQTADFYQENYPIHPALFGFLSYKVIAAVGLDHVYTSWWFISLMILFGSSLAACTYNRQIPMLKVANRWSYRTKPESFINLPLATELPTDTTGKDLSSLAQNLRTKGYKVFYADDRLYARKGLVGRIGPILVHGSMLLILAGAIWGGQTGFIAQEMVPSGETFTIQHLTEAGPWSKSQLPHGWQVRVNRFWIDYTAKGNVDQFYSDLSVIDDAGQEIKRETIHVNQPMRYQGITFYQANWDIAAVRFRLNQSPILQLPVTKLQSQSNGATVWGTWIPTKPDLSAGVTLITPDLQGTFLIYDEKGSLIKTVRAGGNTEINGVTLHLVEVIGSTGLQIKADPGIPLVYAGFAALMVGVVMSYVSHSQVWALQTNSRLYVGGKTNRAQAGFEAELVTILANLTDQTDLPVTVSQQTKI